MEAIAVIGLVSNILQFVDFSARLLSNSSQRYNSAGHNLPEIANIETATNHLILLNDKLKFDDTTSKDNELQGLCASCDSVAVDLLKALDKLKPKAKASKWESIQKALQLVLCKEDIQGLERRLARIREELHLHLTMNVRYKT